MRITIHNFLFEKKDVCEEEKGGIFLIYCPLQAFIIIIIIMPNIYFGKKTPENDGNS
jgi:hypothetical protein